MEDKYLDMNIDDALIEKPYSFTVGEDNTREFSIFPTTIGKLHLLRRHIDNLEINTNNLSVSPQLEVLRVSTAHPREVCRILAYHTLKRKRDIFDSALVNNITDYLEANLTTDEMATILLFVLTRDDIDKYKERLGIAGENERMRKILEAKEKACKGKNDYTFGGKTIYGTLIDTACERYGWSYDYVIWGISYVNLCLLLADKIQNIYISDEEKKNISSSILSDGETINMDDKKNADIIHKMNWK